MTGAPADIRAGLPAPYNQLAFEHRRRGIFDDSAVDVFIDGENSFAALHPRPVIDYTQYVPRQHKLNLGGYRASNDIVARRFAKIGDLFPGRGDVLEIGAAEGDFLAKLRAERPELRLLAVEPDRKTAEARKAIGLAGDYPDLETAVSTGASADTVCLFHVFEHIADPRAFLDVAGRLLKSGGRMIIEVPSLDDPLLSIYRCGAYEAFYFQRQHPFVYSARSLGRVLEANGFQVLEMRPYQRYGLENHLTWLTHGKPGGDAQLKQMFGSLDQQYRQELEKAGKTDTIIAVATPR
jgi:SAM-dependent methyltransferase